MGHTSTDAYGSRGRATRAADVIARKSHSSSTLPNVDMNAPLSQFLNLQFGKHDSKPTIIKRYNLLNSKASQAAAQIGRMERERDLQDTEMQRQVTAVALAEKRNLELEHRMRPLDTDTIQRAQDPVAHERANMSTLQRDVRVKDQQLRETREKLRFADTTAADAMQAKNAMEQEKEELSRQLGL